MHSTVLQFIAETGVLGTLAYGTFMVYLIWVAFSNARRFWGTTWERFYVILFLGFMTLIPSYFYNRHLRERTFWLFIALFFISRKVISREALKCRSERKAIAPLEKSS